ncbi:hypothetical protein PsYK624_057090 [Phanerochaete sordida]|uniref:Uncharacterized protein n=1 Tax=Phanerochaete sordida TaxID=48140 RepID=A0A9P3LBV8_9APHY|nr:hypothetical protein PsYK624_057090 [Phanerochaete sordida]
MLSRTTLQSCRVNARATAGSLSAARTNSTVAPADSGAKPERKRIPVANAFGDLAIPERDAIVQRGGRRALGMSPADFAGRGGLAAHLMAKRAQEVARLSEEKLAQQRLEQTDLSEISLATPPQLANQRERGPMRPRPTRAGPRTAATRAAEKVDTATRTEARPANRRPSRADRARKELMEEMEEELEEIEEGEEPLSEEAQERLEQLHSGIPKTNMEALFETPSPAAHQVIPLQAETKMSEVPKESSAFEELKKRVLEKTAGKYDAYLPLRLARNSAHNSLEKMGAVKYGRLSLSKVYNAPLDQRASALATVVSLTQTSRPAASKTL